ncbi:MAG: ABC transporter substrate-binding protein, partial [Chloroflexota bacterium]
MTNRKDRVHPGVYEVQGQLKQGRMSRREFLRLATLLGVSLPAAQVLAACGTPATPTAAPATTAPTSAVKRGGTLRYGNQIKAIDHPARYEWIGPDANITRFVNEYLTETDDQNITHPYLVEKWDASDDLKTWTLHLRQGIQWFKDGKDLEEFVGDHVKFNFEQWLNPDTKSSIAGLWSGFLTTANIEVADKYTVVLHLDN